MTYDEEEKDKEGKESAQLISTERPDKGYDLDYNYCDVCGRTYRGSSHKCGKAIE